MKIMQKSIAVLMIICMMFTMLPMEFYYLYPTVNAEPLGDTLKIETESKKAPKGGAINTEKPFVRVYLSREPENYLDGTQDARDAIYREYTYKYPKSENLESLFFVDKEYYDAWGFQTFIKSNSLYVADYTQSPTTGLIYTAGPKVTNSMIRTNPTSTIPKNIFKENVINAKKSNVIESSMDLSGKVWEQYRPNYDQALALVNYVFQATPGMNQRFIDVVDKNFNDKDPASLTDDEKFNIATGYGGLLVSLYVVAANRGLADTAGKYSQAIEEYFASDNLNEKPVSLVVDGAFCWIKMNDAGTYSTGYRIAPCIELMEYILATEANYSITAPGADTFIKTRMNGAGTSTINMITEMAKASLETHPWETTKGYMNGTGGPETMLFQRLSDTTYPDVWQDSHLNTSLGFAYRVYQFGDVSSPKATIWTTPNGAGWDSTTRGGLIDFFQFNEDAGTKGFLIASQTISNPVPEVSYFVKNVAQSTQNTCDPVAQPQSAPEITITLGKDSGLMNALIGREDDGAEVKITTKITRDYALDSFSNIQEQDIPMPALEAEFNKTYSVEEFVNSVAGTPLVAKDTSVLGMTIERKTNKVQEMLFTYHVDVTITIDKAIYPYKSEDIVVMNGTEALNTIQFHINAYMEDVVLPEDIVITKPSSTTTTDIINPSENEDLANNTQLVHRYEYASTVDDDEVVVGFAEAKSNEPLDEEWEVMAGIPSSEEIYFSVGGQEFKVAAVLQYWMNEHSRDRTYTMHFDGVKCEYNNEGKGTGDRMAEYFPKAQPTAGGSYTDVSIHCKNEDSSGNGDWKIVAYWSGNSKHDPQNHPCSVCGATIHDNHGTLDTSKYDEAVAAADLLQSQLEAEIIQWTAASDKVLREITWEVSYTAPHDTADGTTTGSDGSANCEGNHGQCGGHPWGPDSEGNSGVNYDSGAAHNTGSPCSSSHAWSITLTATIPDHAICGPCCGHHLPPLWDMWRQGLVYDYVKIGQIRLYALDQGSAEGFTELTGTDKIFANVISGNPTYFMNIAQMTETSQRPKITNGGLATQDKLELGGITYNNYYDYTHYSGQNRRPAQSSRAGRLRYMLEPSLYKTAKKEWTAAEDGDGKGTKITLEYNKVAAPEQHDDVIYKIGVRSTNCDGMSNHYNFGLSGTSVEPVSDLGHKNEWADGCLYTHLLSTTSYSGYHEYGSIGYTYQPKQLAENDVLAMNGTYHEDYNHHVQRDGLTDKEAYSDKADQKDILTEEWMAFNEARRTKIIVDVISDFLIMQTSGGDQSLFYFEKVSPPTEAQEHFQKVKITEKECLDDNPLSIFKAGICPSNVIKDGVYNFEIVGGYNGRYDVPAKKYKPYSLILNDFLKFENEGWSEYNASYDNSSFQTKVGGNYIYTGNSKITTIFDKSFYGTGDPAKTVGRPERKAKNQSTSFKIYQDGIQILPTAPNQLYQPENGLIWYSQLVGYWCTDANVIDATNGSGRRAGPLSDVAIGNPQKSKHSDAYRANWGTNTGVEFNTKYFLRPDGDSGTTTVNGIVVYTPVSVEDAIVLPQGNFNIEGKSISRDQRVNTFDYPDMNDLVNKLKVCPLDPASCEYRVLDCKYLHDTVLAEFNFEPTYNTTEEDTSGDYEHNRKPVTKKNTYTEGGKTYTTNLVNGITYELPSGFTIGTSGFVDGQFLSATGTNSWKIPFSDLGLSSIKTNRVKVSMNLKVNSASNVMVVSFRNLGFIVDSTSNGRFIKTSIDAPSRVGTTKKLTPTIQNVKLDIVFGFNNIIDCTAYVNGVEAGVSYVSDYREQWNTTTNADGQVISKKVLTDVVLDAKALKNEPPTPLSSNDLGGSINIGNWTNGKSNYSANYYIDNLKIILMGGTTEHTSSCYVTETIHNTKMLHVCDENCYLKEDLYTCTGDLNDNYQHGDAYPINWYVCNGVLNSGVAYDCGITNLMHKCTNCGAQAGFYRHCSSGCRQCTCNNCGAQQGHRYGNSNCTGHVHSTSGCTWHYTTHTHSGTEGATPNGCYTKGIHKHYGTAGTDTPNGCYTKPTAHKHIVGLSSYTFNYTGSMQTTKLTPGTYKIEAWGASGGGTLYGQGGYTSGIVTLNSDTTFYMYIGGAGSQNIGGWNGGGTPGTNAYGGGGATDIRLVAGDWNNTSSLQSRILVAGGGGGAADDVHGSTYAGNQGGYGGGLVGGSGAIESEDGTNRIRATGGTQTAGGSGAINKTTYPNTAPSGAFGIGGNGNSTNGHNGGGAGAGYYGGGGGSGWYQAGGAGGSSFVTGYTGCDTTYRSQHNGLNFSNVVMSAGGNTGNGKIIITKVSNSKNFSYTGYAQTYTVPKTGYYLLEAWGASGGTGYGNANAIGQGGYTKGVVKLTEGTKLYVYVGEDGVDYTKSTTGFNGGGAAFGGEVAHKGGRGGGATDFRLVGGAWNNTSSLQSRILVAGGGGGAQSSCGGSNCTAAGHGGGLVGGTSINKGTYYTNSTSYGGSQTAGGTFALGNSCANNGVNGSFGTGAYANTCASGGGGGWYGGASLYTTGGGGGSSYVTGYTGCDTTYRSSQGGYNFTGVGLLQGGNIGNGKASITLVETCDMLPAGTHVCTGIPNQISDYNVHQHTTDCFEDYYTLPARSFMYTGDVQTYTVPYSDYYKIEVYGPSSGNKCGYASAVVFLNRTKQLYIYVGGTGGYNSKTTDVRMVAYPTNANSAIGEEALLTEAQQNSLDSRILMATGSLTGTKAVSLANYPLTDIVTSLKGNDTNGRVIITPLNRTPHLKGEDTILEQILAGDIIEEDAHKYLGEELANTIINTAQVFKTYDKFSWLNTQGVTPATTATEGVSFSNNRIICQVNTSGGDEFYLPVDIGAKALRQVKVTLDNYTTSTSFGIHMGTVNGTKLYTSVPMQANKAGQTITIPIPKTWRVADIKNLWFDPSPGTGLTGRVEISKIQLIGHADVLKDNNSSYALSNLVTTKTFTSSDKKGFANLSNTSLTFSNNNMVVTSSGSNPQTVWNAIKTIDTSAVKAIKLVFTNKSASATTGELYYKDATNTWNETDVFKWNVGSSSVGAQTVWIDTVNHSAYNETTKVFTKAGSGWTGTVTGIRFDWTQLTSGGLEVSEITFIGKGTMSVDYTYDYTGTAQSIKLPKGTWQVDLWGAQGGDGRLGNTTTMVESGGKGGHTEGQITADGSTTYYIYIGGKGGSAGTASQSFGAGGWNGGGPGGTELRPEGQPENGAGGGGMTHITTSSTDKLTTSTKIETTSSVKYGSGYTWSYSYTGGSQTVTLLPGTYKLEVWGAGGGTYSVTPSPGGYASGTITLTSATPVTINVGGAGGGGSGGAGGWNGGANGASHSGGGGGKTDIAVNGTIVIAGGGGAAGGHHNTNGTNGYGGVTLAAYGSGGGSSSCSGRGTGGASYIGGVTNGTATAGGGSAARNHGKAVITATTAIYDTAYSMGVTETATFDTSKVIMVAGGGGGGSGSTGSSDVAGATTWGGNGGGTSGVSTNTNTTAGTQTSGYKQGLGGPGYSYFPGSSDLNYGSSGGGGGGWYGGYTSSNLTITGTRGGAGGSSYIKSGTVTGGSTTAGQRSGNGYATIKSVSVTGTVLFNSGTGTGKFGIATATYSPVRFQAAYKNPFENETTARKTIYDNIDLIPDFVDGDYNPIWVCKFAEINGHACEKVEKDGSITTLCVTQTRLDCREPHHKGVMTDKDGNVLKDDNGKPICKEHYGGSNRICWSACENDDNHKNTKDEVQVTNGNKVETLKLADYLQLDEGFTIYFPNIGDFKGNNALGLASPQLDRGYGYSNRMETTRWTREKRVRFPFDVIFEEVDGTQQIYKAYSWIELDVPTEYFNFYLLVENQEMSNASVEFECEAINCATSEGLNVAPGVTYSNTVSDTYATALQNFLDTYVATMYNEVKKGYQMPLAVADGKNTISSTAYDKTGYLNFYVTKETVNEAKLRTAMSKINSTIEKEFEGDTSGVINPHNNKFTGINEDVKLITYNDNKVRVNNKVRADSLQSLHGGYKHFYLDVIGRIGNFAIVDTEDFRFSNFFKMPIMSDSDASAMGNPDNWVVEGLVKVVDDGVQNFYVGDTYDLRGNKAGVNNRWLDTYGTMSWMAGQLINGNRDITKPNLVSQILTGEINNIDVFKEEELRYGYDAYTSIITFGSYDTGSVQVVPKYYALKVTDRDLDNVPAEFNVKKGTYIPLDVYIDADGVYSPVNIFGNAGNGNSNIGGIEMNDYSFNLDWTDEELRRNYSLEEKARTLKLKEEFKRVVYDMSSVDVDDTDVDYSKLPILKIIEYPAPQGKANYLGTSQYILMTAAHRTFVGSSNSYDNNTGGKSVWNSRAGTMTVEVDKNIVDAYDTSNPNAINEIQFERAVQRWHGKLGLPSSAIFVPHNTKSDELTEVNEETIEYVMGENQDDWVIVCTAETIAIGAVWSIYYSQPWFDTLTINGNSFKTSAHYPGHRVTDGNGNSVECPDCIPPIISVFGKTSVDDVEIVQTH